MQASDCGVRLCFHLCPPLTTTCLKVLACYVSSMSTAGALPGFLLLVTRTAQYLPNESPYVQRDLEIMYMCVGEGESVLPLSTGGYGNRKAEIPLELECWELNLGPPEEQQDMILTTEPSPSRTYTRLFHPTFKSSGFSLHKQGTQTLILEAQPSPPVSSRWLFSAPP